MMHRVFRIAIAVALACPLLASACTLNQPNSRTLVFGTDSADCKISGKEMAQYRAQLAKALASLSPAPSGVQATRQAAAVPQQKTPSASTAANRRKVGADRRFLVENM